MSEMTNDDFEYEEEEEEFQPDKFDDLISQFEDYKKTSERNYVELKEMIRYVSIQTTIVSISFSALVGGMFALFWSVN
jgi:uncharacterized protein (DUF927 family)